MMNKLILTTTLALSATAAAQDQGPVPAQGQGQVQEAAPLRAPRCADPCVPQRLRQAPANPSATPPASGEALQRQAVAKLRQRFNEADLDGNGALTLDEARKAGLGWVVNHFADIDTAGSGKVTFDDMRQYIGKRRRQALGPSAPQ